MEIIFYFITAAGMYKVLEKAKFKDTWHALIPGLSVWSLAKISNVSVVFTILGVIFSLYYGFALLYPSAEQLISLKSPTLILVFVMTILITLVGYARVFHAVAKSFGKGFWYSAGLIFFPFIFFPILGFGNAVYMPKNIANEEAVPATI